MNTAWSGATTEACERFFRVISTVEMSCLVTRLRVVRSFAVVISKSSVRSSRDAATVVEVVDIIVVVVTVLTEAVLDAVVVVRAVVAVPTLLVVVGNVDVVSVEVTPVVPPESSIGVKGESVGVIAI